MPFTFTWIIKGRLGACSAPRSSEDLRALRERDISLVVNLLETPHPQGALDPHGLRELHLPVRDFTAPTLDQIVEALAAINEALAAKRAVAVHCAAGIGRTGTLVACYLVSIGMSAADAIARVRRLRPGSLEVDEQVDAVSRFETVVRAKKPPVH